MFYYRYTEVIPMATELVIKKIGNSFGVIFPKRLMEEKRLKTNETVVIEVVKKADLRKAFGSLKERKMSGQEFKDLVRKGWN
jgi:antitoxin component of MazEF toxin-antitoxin module